MTIAAETLKPRIRTPRKKTVDVPPYLVYETLGGIPVLYKGWKNVLSGKQDFEGIIGYVSIQWMLISFLKDYLQPLFGKGKWVLSGEGGLSISQETILTVDLAIIDRRLISLKTLTNNYLAIPPEVVINVDSKADLNSLPYSADDYYHVKTQQLLDFGTEQVVWIYSENKKIVIAKPDQPWLTVNWTDEIEIIGHRFTLQSMIDSFELENE